MNVCCLYFLGHWQFSTRYCKRHLICALCQKNLGVDHEVCQEMIQEQEFFKPCIILSNKTGDECYHCMYFRLVALLILLILDLK